MDKSLGKRQRALLAEIVKCPAASGYYLAGGTALNIQLGHRVSIDLDFFNEKGINTEKLAADLGRQFSVEVTGMETGSLHLNVNGIQVSYFEYPYKLLEKCTIEGIDMASLKDIGLMKIIAIMQRGLRKDFLDLYAICQSGIPLQALFDLLDTKFPNARFDMASILKALNYFEDANDAVPVTDSSISWDKVRKFFKAEVKRLSL